MFRPSRSSSGPPRKQIQELFSFSALWDPKCLHVSVTGVPVTETCKHLVETCRPDTHTHIYIYCVDD